MEKYPETLEDLLCYLECARDSLLMIHNVIEAETASSELIKGAVYGSFSHLDFIAKAMAEHIQRIPADVLRKAGNEVSEKRT